MDTIRLYNGVEMPVLGYGVFLIPPAETERCVLDALSVGYRMIDTAQAYQNEEGVGAAIAKSGISRNEIFLVTKVWLTNGGEAKASASIDASLGRLGTDYVDLLLIHQAYNDVFGTWRALEAAYRSGKARAIGVSNFQAGRFFDFAHFVDTKPMVNQLQCNTSVQQKGIKPLLDEFDCRMMAWAPLGGEGGMEDVIKNPVLEAIGKRHGKTAPQVALRWLNQNGIVAIPKSTHRQRMEQNLDIFDFELTADDLAAIDSLNIHDTGTRNYGDPNFLKFIINRFNL